MTGFWTTNLPTEPGFYWLRSAEVAIFVAELAGGVWWFTGTDGAVLRAPGKAPEADLDLSPQSRLP